MILPQPHRPVASAFAQDRTAQVANAAAKAAWWGATAWALRKVTRPASAPSPAAAEISAPAAPKSFLRRSWLEAFEKDARDVATGLYPPMSDRAGGSALAPRRTADLFADARRVDARRRRGGATEAREDAPAGRGFPAYYRQNFHFQSGGWFTPESARRYEAQVEALFAGAAGAMRRRALSLLAKAWADTDHRGRAVLDLACGSGAFLENLTAAFPRARMLGADLSQAYLAEARRRSGVTSLALANAERLPFADASLDAVTCVYLFHELPPKARKAVAREIARVLKPGGLLAFADSVQSSDEPRLERLLQAFPAYFHEPFYASYGATDLPALFAEAGLAARDQDRAFLTKAILFEKVG